MKRAVFVDGNTKSRLPSMKTAENVDGNIKTRLSSMKRAVFMDGNTKSRLPSMKKRPKTWMGTQNPAAVHENGRKRGWEDDFMEKNEKQTEENNEKGWLTGLQDLSAIPSYCSKNLKAKQGSSHSRYSCPLECRQRPYALYKPPQPFHGQPSSSC